MLSESRVHTILNHNQKSFSGELKRQKILRKSHCNDDTNFDALISHQTKIDTTLEILK